MKMLDIGFGIVGTLAAIAAAGFWFYASLIEIPANMDTFIGELQRASRWNAYGAGAASVAALCAAYGFGRQQGWF